ncbi:hypothetical protein J2Y49_005505 [Azospirillum sp. BE72]|nr:hypothetical protein [Azospirillum sp. BE72]
MQQIKHAIALTAAQRAWWRGPTTGRAWWTDPALPVAITIEAGARHAKRPAGGRNIHPWSRLFNGIHHAYFGEFAQAFRLKAPTVSAKPPTRIASWWVPGPKPGFTL